MRILDIVNQFIENSDISKALSMKTQIKKLEERLALPFLFLPSQKDIDNCKELSDRLKGNSIKETITNILEYQESISYWKERNYFCVIFVIWLISGLIPAVLWKLFPMSYTPYEVYLRDILIIGTSIGIGFGSLFIIFFILSYKRMGWRFFFYSLLLSPMPVNKILEYKLAICCDYAKLTASLLFHVPDIEIYFIRKASHVTVGINIKSEGSDKIFVLDQRLPISTLDDWMQKKKSNAYLYISENKNGKVTFDYIKTEKYIKRKYEPQIDTEKLSFEIAESLRIEENKATSFKLEPPLKFYAYKDLNYDMIRYSLIRAIKKILEIEFCGNIHKISKITIFQDKENLIVDVYYGNDTPYTT